MLNFLMPPAPKRLISKSLAFFSGTAVINNFLPTAKPPGGNSVSYGIAMYLPSHSLQLTSNLTVVTFAYKHFGQVDVTFNGQMSDATQWLSMFKFEKTMILAEHFKLLIVSSYANVERRVGFDGQ